jgi:ABC-type transport system involved in multi-copper enzyme maturation permease subunit
MKQELLNIFIIAKYTFFEVLKSRILLNVFFLGMALLFFSYTATEFTYGAATKVALDFGLGALSLSAVGIAIFIGVNIVNKEIESRTIYILLSQPLSRTAFLIGRVTGMSILLLVNILILGVLTLLIYFLFGGEFQPLIIWCVVFSFVEAVIVLNIAVLFSLITNITMSVVYTLIVFTIGHSINDAIEMTNTSYKVFNPIVKSFAVFIPNFSKINIKSFVLYQKNLDLSYLVGALSYGLFYIMIIMLISSLIFKNKDLN